jgi:membrane protein implicated in regulation of membrane protease activity
VAALLTLLAWLLAGILLLLAGLLTAALLLAWLLIGILALLTRIRVRIVLIAHVGISLVSHGRATTRVTVGCKGTPVPLRIF